MKGTGPGPGIAVPGAHRFSHEAMATLFEIVCAGGDRAYARQAARAAFDLIDRLERELSRFIENSDISRINAVPAGETLAVCPWTMECLQIARQAWVETGGAFDVSIGSGMEKVELIPAGHAVRILAEGVRLDLGGIGKGYAIDRAADLLEEWGIERAIVNGGFSSVLALEPPQDDGGWPLTLSMPGVESHGVFARISARRQALSGSGIRKRDHIVDPRTLEPVRGRQAAWVAVHFPGPGAQSASEGPAILKSRGSPAAVAEVLSTAFMILSPEEIAECCRNNPALEAWLIPESSGGEPGPGRFLYMRGPAPGEAGEGHP